MYELRSNDSTYIVPLDSLDLTYLNRHFDERSVRPLPLWRIPKSDEYFEFKINAWRTSDSDDGEEDADIISSECQLCHVCNIHVPVIYIKEHNNSEIHRNMRKILNLMVARGRNADLSPSQKPQTKSCYYCEDCSMVIADNSKETHEASYTHKKSQRNKSLIEQFLKYYSEDFCENSNNKILPLQDYFNKFVNRKNLSFKIDVIDEDVLRIFVKDYKLKVNCDNFHGFMKTEAELICILCEMPVGRVAKLIEQHIESKRHRKKITRVIDDKHCLREFNDSFAHCILCNELVLLYRIEGHKMVSYHIANLNLAQGRKDYRDINKNYILPQERGDFNLYNAFRKYLKDELADKEAISEDKERVQALNEVEGSKNIVSHTTDVVSKTYPTHKDKHSFYHHIDKHDVDNLIVEQLPNNNHVVKDNKQSVKDCDDLKKTSTVTKVQVNEYVANVYQQSGADSIDTNETNMDLAKDPVTENAIPPDTEPIHIPEEFFEQIHYLTLGTFNENEIICKVCGILMLNTDLKLYNHFNGDNHTTKYNELLKSNRVTRAQNKFFCYLCKASITNKNELEHIFGIRHRNKSGHNTDERIYCELCNVYISYSVKEHQITKQHLQGNNIDIQTQIVEEDDLSSDNTSDILSYEDSIEETYTKVKNFAPSEKSVNVPAVFLKLHYHFAKTANPLEVLCKICNLVVPNSVVTIDTHVEGFYHTNKYDNLLKYNRMKNDGSQYRCQICDVFVSYRNEIEHIAGYKHKSKMADGKNNDDQTSDEISDDETIPTLLDTKNDESTKEAIQTSNQMHVEIIDNCDDKTIQDDIIENDNTIQITNAQVKKFSHAATRILPESVKTYYHLSKTSNNSEVLCKICNIPLRNSIINIHTHVQGNSHTNKYSVLLESNGVEDQGYRFYCKICDVSVTAKTELEHIEGDKHKNKMTATNSNDDKYCDDIVEYSDNIDEYSDNLDEISDEGTSDPLYEVVDPVKGTIKISNDSESVQSTNATVINLKKVEPDSLNIHYHMSIINKSEVLCKICNVILSNSIRNINNHVQGNNHSSKYRDLLHSNRVEHHDYRFHCKFCDAFVPAKNEIEHIRGNRHKNSMAKEGKNSTHDENSYSRAEKSDKGTSGTLNTTIAEPAKETIDKSQHLLKAITVKQIQPDYLNIHYHMSITNDTELLCKVCNVILTNSIANVNTHIQGNNHSNKYTDLLESNKIIKYGLKFYCKICDEFISTKNEIDHIESSKHKNRMDEVLGTNSSDNENCDDGDEISVDYDEIFADGDEISDIDTPGPLYSTVANPTKETIERSNTINDVVSTQTTSATAIYLKQIQPDYLNIHYHMSVTNDSKVLCKICNVILSNSIVNVNTHVQGNSHSNKYKHLLESNKIENRDHRFYCKICDVYLPLRNDIEHLEGGKHKRNVSLKAAEGSNKITDQDSDQLSVDETPEAVEETKRLVQTDQIPKHVETNNNTENIQESNVDLIKPHYHVSKIANTTEVLCKICNVVLSNSVVNINAHIQGYNHSYLYRSLLENNKVEKDDNTFRCRACDVVVSNKNEIEHIYGMRHKNNMQNEVNNTNNDVHSDPRIDTLERLRAALYKLDEYINAMDNR